MSMSHIPGAPQILLLTVLCCTSTLGWSCRRAEPNLPLWIYYVDHDGSLLEEQQLACVTEVQHELEAAGIVLGVKTQRVTRAEAMTNNVAASWGSQRMQGDSVTVYELFTTHKDYPLASRVNAECLISFHKKHGWEFSTSESQEDQPESHEGTATGDGDDEWGFKVD